MCVHYWTNGSYIYIYMQGCARDPAGQNRCNPHSESCADVRMHHWSPHYYHDLCSPHLRVRGAGNGRVEYADSPITESNDAELEALAKMEMCKVGLQYVRFIMCNFHIHMACPSDDYLLPSTCTGS